MGKKTIISLVITVVILIVAIWVFGSAYSVAREQYLDGHEKSKELVLNKGELSSIQNVETFNGNIKYHVMSAENAKDEKVYVWVPQTEKNEKVIIKKQSSGITEEEAISKVNQEYDPIKIVDVKLGMDEGIPIWEVKYKDQSDRYTFDFVNFYDGEIIKHMAIKNEKHS
ncbi:MAG: DUF5590 domain-containing protein [Bacillota bacterium]